MRKWKYFTQQNQREKLKSQTLASPRLNVNPIYKMKEQKTDLNDAILWRSASLAPEHAVDGRGQRHLHRVLSQTQLPRVLVHLVVVQAAKRFVASHDDFPAVFLNIFVL